MGELNKVTLVLVELNDELFINVPESTQFINNITEAPCHYLAILRANDQTGSLKVEGVFKKNLIVQYVTETIMKQARDNSRVYITGYNADAFVRALLGRRMNRNLEANNMYDCDLLICCNSQQSPTRIIFESN